MSDDLKAAVLAWRKAKAREAALIEETRQASHRYDAREPGSGARLAAAEWREALKETMNAQDRIAEAADRLVGETA